MTHAFCRHDVFRKCADPVPHPHEALLRALVVIVLPAIGAVPAAHVRLQRDSVAHPTPGDIRAELHDLARQLVTRDHRRSPNVVRPLECRHVAGTDPSGLHPYENLASTRCRNRHLDDLGFPRLRKPHCLHESVSF
jgi:hypothetical protein